MASNKLLLTTILGTGLTLYTAQPLYAADSITSGTVNTATAPISNAAIADPRVAATSFVEHVNYARVALAMRNIPMAQQHITQAQSMITLIKGIAPEQRRIQSVQSGRIVYEYDTPHKYHYFPVQTGPVQVKKMDNGMIWSKNSLAVADADIVYLSLDLRGDQAETYLADAAAAITAKDFKGADSKLAALTEAVVTVDSKVTVPSDKARDNIALARNFIAGKNYDGARFALKHADEALNEMQTDDRFIGRRPMLTAMSKDISELQDYIGRNDPTMIEKADKKIDKWWNELSAWAENDK
jgi:hypothetical protein